MVLTTHELQPTAPQRIRIDQRSRHPHSPLVKSNDEIEYLIAGQIGGLVTLFECYVTYRKYARVPIAVGLALE